MFHQNKGANVSLDDTRNTATWSPMVTGGCAFLRLPLAHNQLTIFKLDGSGAVELGVTYIDPTKLAADPPNTSSHIPNYILLNDIKLHKRECRMTVSVNSLGTEVTSSYGTGQYVKNVSSGKKYWLVIDVKYGEVEVKIENQGNENNPNEFLPVHGNNIQVMNDTSLIRSSQKTPATVTFLESPLKAGKGFIFHCKPRPFDGTIPGRFSVTARISKIDPDRFKTMFPAEFDISVKDKNAPELIEVERFEKDECNGDVCLDVYEDKLAYTTATGKANKHPYPIKSSKSTWLLLWLYGVSVTVECRDVPDAAGEGQTTLMKLENDAGHLMPNRNREYLQVSNARANREGTGNYNETRKLRKSVDAMTGVVQELAKRLDSQEEATICPVVPVGLQPSSGPLPPITMPVPIPTRGNQKPAQAVKTNQTTTSNTEDTTADENKVLLGQPIKINFVFLRENLNCDELMDYLYEANVITLEEMSTIGSKPTKVDTNRSILTVLSQRPVSKKVLSNALEKTSQGFLISKFFPDDLNE